VKVTWLAWGVLAVVLFVLVTGMVASRIGRVLRARRRAYDDAVWARTFGERGGNVTTFPGYDRQLQKTAVDRKRVEERRRLRELQARTKTKPRATVVSIAERKAAR
jgi:hypothetical protein